MRSHGSHAVHRTKRFHRSYRFNARRGFVSVICLRNNLSQNKGSSLILVSGIKRVVLSFNRTIAIQIG